MTGFEKVNAAALAANLPFCWYPGAKRQGQSLRIGNLKGDAGSSLWVCLRSGAWKDHASGDSGGDLVSLYAAREGISQSEAKKRLAQTLGEYSQSPASIPERSSNTERAKALWRESLLIQGTQAEAYLQSRNISHLPRSLRFHSEAYHGPTQRKYPAMIAAITRWPEKSPHAVHRTFLEGNNKATVDPCRMMLGEIAGGAVRLGPVDQVIAVGEGLESCLSFQQLTGIPTWAVLSTSNYLGLVLPETVKEITIAADHDDAGISAAHEAGAVWAKTGRMVRVVFPPAKGKDFNDIHRKQDNDK
jgi:phage/plasmid primase-like uncharacterized protein